MSTTGSINSSKSGASISSTSEAKDVPQKKKKGLSYLLTAFFLIAQMAGAGFLALPRAMADSGWVGIPMMLIFCVLIGFSGTRLGECWVMLEERWPEYKENSRTPYMEIAFRTLGIHGRRLAWASVVITLFGATTVFIILAAGMSQTLIEDAKLSLCEWVIIIGAILIPLTWMGTPKDFWQASIIAVAATFLACIIIFILLFVEAESFEPPEYTNPTIGSFSLGFGAILFGFGGASVFPTIQNDMENRSEFWKGVVICFISLLAVYFPLALAGYVMIGSTVNSNILLAVPTSVASQFTIGMEVLNLIGTYIIGFNAVGQAFEDLFNVPNKFSWQRCVIRSCIVVVEVIIGLGVPDFGAILNLIGGSTVTICSFLLPPIMYIKLVDSKPTPEDKWKGRQIPLWERILLWEIVILGVVGGIASTVSAFIAIVGPGALGNSCFTDFNIGL